MLQYIILAAITAGIIAWRYGSTIAAHARGAAGPLGTAGRAGRRAATILLPHWITGLVALAGIALALSASSIGTAGFWNWGPLLVLSSAALVAARLNEARLGPAYKPVQLGIVGLFALMVLAIPAWSKMQEFAESPPEPVGCSPMSEEPAACVFSGDLSPLIPPAPGLPAHYRPCSWEPAGVEVKHELDSRGVLMGIRFLKTDRSLGHVRVVYQNLPPDGCRPGTPRPI